MAANLSPPEQNQPASLGRQVRNLLIVLVAVALSVAVFLGFRTQQNTVSLSALAKASTPLERALTNQKPTLMEFYANWCTSCQAMAQDIYDLEQQYGEQLNVVMLNVDNPKWLPEMLHYRVDGIPHFIFLNPQGETIASAIGLQPRSILEANVSALVAGNPLPHAGTTGKVSLVEIAAKPRPDDPRGHGGQPGE